MCGRTGGQLSRAPERTGLKKGDEEKQERGGKRTGNVLKIKHSRQ